VMRRLIGAPAAVAGEMLTPRIPRPGSPGTRPIERTGRTTTVLRSVFAGTTSFAFTARPKSSRRFEFGLTGSVLFDPNRARARVGWEPRQQRSVQTCGPRKAACGLGFCVRDSSRGLAVAGAEPATSAPRQHAVTVKRAAMRVRRPR
jgi:hypothetical protein